MAKAAKKSRRSAQWISSAVESVRSQLTWPDLLFGVFAALLLAGLLVGYRFQSFPQYQVGDVAAQNIRAPQDLLYEDRKATASQREAARERVPAVWELDVVRIAELQARLARAFEAARRILTDQQVSEDRRMTLAQRDKLLTVLEEEVGEDIPAAVLPLLLDRRFSPELESKMLRILDAILRSGIVADTETFRRDMERGVVLRDRTTLLERPLTEFSGVRSLEAAREYLRQFQLEFPELPARARPPFFSFLDSYLAPTLFPNIAETAARREAAAARVSRVEVQVKRGETIIRAGEKVSERSLADIQALQNLQRPRSVITQLTGFSFFVASFLYTLWHYFVHHQSRHRKIRNHMLLLLVVVGITILVMRLLTGLAGILSELVAIGPLHDSFNLYYAIPFSLAAILITMLVDSNVGMIVSIMVSTLVGLFYGDVYLAAYSLIGSLAGVYSIRQYKERLSLLKSGLTISVVSILAIPGIHLVRQDSLTLTGQMIVMAVAATGGLLASLLCSLLLPALESLFRVTTDVRLLELSNLNAPMLRRLAVEAPGTYHHSLMVGTLGEAAAESVGANPLLVRVAAYYHDIGKMQKPEYFLENQGFGSNKHESLTPSMSCLILTSHVKDGLLLAREAGLTQAISDMIPQHHGTRVMTFFYQKARDTADEKTNGVEESDFRYPGPKPQTKEAAILMMADSVEAASRTLTHPSPAQITGMIDRLIMDILADDQLDECDITIREIRLVKQSFVKVLGGIHHRRIDYPGYDFRVSGERPERAPLPSAGDRQAKAI